MRHFVQGLVFLLDIVLILIVHMDVCSFDVGETFELALQGLADVVGDLERHALVHDDVDFDVVLLPGVVGAALMMY